MLESLLNINTSTAVNPPDQLGQPKNVSKQLVLIVFF